MKCEMCLSNLVLLGSCNILVCCNLCEFLCLPTINNQISSQICGCSQGVKGLSKSGYHNSLHKQTRFLKTLTIVINAHRAEIK